MMTPSMRPASRQAWLVKAAVELMHKQDLPVTDDDLSRVFGPRITGTQPYQEEAVNEYA